MPSDLKLARPQSSFLQKVKIYAKKTKYAEYDTNLDFTRKKLIDSRIISDSKLRMEGDHFRGWKQAA